MEKHKITREIEALATNKERLQKWMSLGLHPKYGLSQELIILMYKIYTEASGDGQYNGKYSCGACQDVIFRKLKDFLEYGDNLGTPLFNWEAPVELKLESDSNISPSNKKSLKNKKTKDEDRTDTTSELE